MIQEQPSRRLSACQQRWLEHLHACEQRNISMQRYAAEQQLSACAMYAAKRDLKRRGVLTGASSSDVGPGKSLTLVPVALRGAALPDTPVVRVTVPGGVTLELFAGADVHVTQALVNAVLEHAR